MALLGDDLMPSPERWDVRVRTDAPNEGAVAALVEGLRGEGHAVEVEGLPSRYLGFRLGVGAIHELPEQVGALERRITALVASLALEGPTALEVDAGLSRSPEQVEIDLPVRMFREGRYEEAIRGFAPAWDCVLSAPGEHPELTVLFAEMGFKSYYREGVGAERPVIEFGGAPLALLQHIAALVHVHSGHRCELLKAWGDSDDDIVVFLPGAGASVPV